jgi:hypothetical protein
MQDKTTKHKNRPIKKSPFVLSLTLIFLNLAGCSNPADVIYLVKKDTAPTNADIIGGYYRTGLRLSNAADVFDEMYMPEYELISQSKNVIAVTEKRLQIMAENGSLRRKRADGTAKVPVHRRRKTKNALRQAECKCVLRMLYGHR